MVKNRQRKLEVKSLTRMRNRGNNAVPQPYHFITLGFQLGQFLRDLRVRFQPTVLREMSKLKGPPKNKWKAIYSRLGILLCRHWPVRKACSPPSHRQNNPCRLLNSRKPFGPYFDEIMRQELRWKCAFRLIIVALQLHCYTHHELMGGFINTFHRNKRRLEFLQSPNNTSILLIVLEGRHESKQIQIEGLTSNETRKVANIQPRTEQN